MKKDILLYNDEELTEMMTAGGEKKYRGRQIYDWLHKKLAVDFDDMTNLSRELREKLTKNFDICRIITEDRQISGKDGTEKYLFRFADRSSVESVFMRNDYGNSVCISSQVGCRMGCVFCASTKGGLSRNLTSAEMLSQVYQIRRSIGERISHVVIMGMGEPLDNYEHVVKAIRMLTDEYGQNISQRNVTVSTCGIVPGIKKLAGENMQMTLALSLHGATQEKRKKLMPVALTYPLEEVMEACRYYYQMTGRRVSFEYSLVTGINDTEEDLHEITRLLKKEKSHLNLIPVNPVEGKKFVKPQEKNVISFQNKLEKNGINVTIRRERGADINGACGQLRQHHMKMEVHK